MKKSNLHLFIIYSWFVIISSSAQALKVEITQGQICPDPIAITYFHNPDSALKLLGENIANVVSNDLLRSGLFEPLSRAAFIQTEESLTTQEPRYADWRLIKARFLVCGSITAVDNTKITIDFHLHDVITGQKLLSLSLTGERLKWRKISHMIADAIYSRITNEKGFFNTHIVYVETLGKRGKHARKRLMRMDQDGENLQPLTDGNHLVLMPRYSPDNRMVAYLGYFNNKAHVHVMDLASGKESKLAGLDQLLKGFGEMTFAPRFTPDSKGLLITLVKGGKSAIYHFDFTSRTLTTLTQHRSIDTSPCPSPDGKQIVFTTDRDREGGEQIYVMDSNGGNVHRISFGEGKYSQPVWSPRGDLIAFTKQHKGKFYIGLMAPDGTGERLIAEGYLLEAPDWAPNGRYLIFTRENRSSRQTTGQLVMIDLTGHHQLPIKASTDSTDCSWSPLLN
jgi:TolB protein